ncbi:ATP-binding protein [Ensifer sp. Root142]|uniref:ATP-binding protein n=1 Tax=Ensifer sp. Root142 TaxID=1736461 RepID=UPI0009E7222D|nr:ATP-binding protein [Ensifer sp. Root142]
MQFTHNPPDASALMSSARSFGNYDLSSAIADLLDNSIKARSTHIDILCVRRNGEAEVRILDNGHGMSAAELHQAMRPASTNPTTERAPDDLGRFGWGMKSASLSQCRRLTVVSHNGEIHTGAVWDLDDLADWKMGILEPDEITAAMNPRLKLESGTEIIWTRCDRLSEDGAIEGRGFNDMVAHAKSQLAMTFHRYLTGEEGIRKLSICFNGDNLKAADPFLRNHEATQSLPREVLQLRGYPIDVQAFVLPHYSKLTSADHERLGGEEGFVRNQGFYIYRQHRLIMHGTWFRLVRHGELSQLVRIAVNIPNSLDEVWKITLDKADAQLPSGLRARLKDIVDGLRGKSGKVFQSRGARIRPGSGTTPVWSKYVRNGEVRYYINREHPLLADLLEAEDERLASAVGAAIGIIEESFPVLSIGEDVHAKGALINQGAIDREAFIERLDAVLPSLLHRADGKLVTLTTLLKTTEPWASHGLLVKEHLKSKGWWQDA